MIFWFEKHNKVSWLITIFIAIVIFYMSSLTFPLAPPIGFPWKSVAYHFYVFFFLAGFLFISILKGKITNKKFIFLTILIALLYAISDEIHQIFVLGRACTISDILINLIGILLAAFLYCLILLRMGKSIN